MQHHVIEIQKVLKVECEETDQQTETLDMQQQQPMLIANKMLSL
jgi:hypothetical protein